MGCSKCGNMLDTDLDFDGGNDQGSILEIPALGHSYATVAAKAATCTEDGWSEHEACERCDDKVGFVKAAATDHNYAPATCTAPATCACGATDGAADGHKMVYVFDETSKNTFIDGTTTTDTITGWIKLYAGATYASLVDTTSGVINKTCATDGMKQFKICHVCAAKVLFNIENYAEQDEKLAWGNLDLLERFEYIVANSYTEGYEAAVVPASHTWENYFTGTANANGEYIPAICGTEGLKNFEVCKACAEPTANYSLTSVAAIQTMTTKQGTANRPEVYAKGLEAAITPALTHNYVNPVTGVNTYKAGLDQTCAADGFTEAFTCFNANCPVGTKVSTVLTRDAHDGEVAGMFDATKVENVNTKIAKCGKANYCGDCKTYWGTPVACVTANISKTVNCTEAGYIGTICVDCATKTYTSYVPATGHQFGSNPVSAQPATCTTAEIKAHYTCDNGCGAKAFGTEIKDAQGNVTGMKYAITTSVAGAPRLGHSIVKAGSTTVVATSGAAFCSTLVNDIKAYLNNPANNATSCTAYAGLSDYSCSRNCGWYASLSNHNSLTDGAWYVDELGYPTSTVSAYNYNNKVISVMEYLALDVAEQAKATVCVFKLANTKIATCIADGTCGICNEVVKVATGHYFDTSRSTDNKNYFATKYATCTTNGVYEYFACTNANCAVISYVTSTGAYSSVAKDANGNDVELTKGNAATYLAIKAHGHNLYVVAAQAPTCTEIGWKEYKACRECSYKENYQEVAKVAHNSFAMGSCSAEVVCDKAYEVAGVWYGCGATIRNTNHQPNNHDWNALTGECECCKLACEHASYVNHVCTVCGKHD